MLTLYFVLFTGVKRPRKNSWYISNITTTEKKSAAPLIFINAAYKGQHLLAMVDSGAEVNVIGEELVKKLKCCYLPPRKLSLKGCGGSTTISQWVIMDLQLSNGQQCEITAVVAKEFGTALLLGSPFLHETGAIIDYGSYLLKTKYGATQLVVADNLPESNRKVHAITVPKVTENDQKLLTDLLAVADLTDLQKKEVRDLLLEFSDLWAGNPRGTTTVCRHSINVTTNRPVRQKPRRFTPEQQQVIDKEVAEMLKNGIIRPSNSPHAQEVVLVKKKTGDWRFCVDYRKINDITIPDEHPLPRIQDLVRSVRNSKYFCALDLRSGYWQILMDEKAIPYTAFRTRSGLYEFLVMAFGLKNAPATFSRLMDKVVGDMYWRGVCVYLDDVLIHSCEFTLALQLLREVLTRLRAAKLTLAVNKCLFFPKSLLYLGYLIENGTLRPNPGRIEALKRIKTPKNVRDVRSLLGCIGYFRQFISNYSYVAEPLNRLLRKGVPFVWSKECEVAKNQLINQLVVATLSNQMDGEFLKLETDASNIAIGAALYCRTTKEDPWRPIEFLSKSLSNTERNWPVHEREAYAIVYSLEKFDAYLRGKKFDVYTDNASLKWMNTAKPGKIARWAGRLGEYFMTIYHRPGKSNVCADFLSRYVDNEPERFLPDRATVWTIQASLPKIEDIIDAQKVEFPPRGPSYFQKDGIIFFSNRIWVPPSKRLEVIEKYHNLIIYHHPGIKRTLTAIRKVFSWSGIQVDVTKFIKSCLVCQRLRPGAECMQGFVSSHTVESPFSHVYMDIFTITIDEKSYNILTIIDNHTKWAEAAILPSKTAKTIAETFIKVWICRFGCPAKLTVDNEPTFAGQVLENLCAMLGTRRLPTIVAHPDGNAPVESFHRVLTKGFQRRCLLASTHKLEMDEVLQLILYGYRLSFHSTTGETPAYLTLGIDPRPPVATYAFRARGNDKERIGMLNTIREDLIQKSYLRNIQKFNLNQEHRELTPLEVGELVLLPIERSEAVFHIIPHHGKKVMPKFTMPYRVISVFNSGRFAHCKSLCPISRNSTDIREASIQDLRRITPPLTPTQVAQWQEVLKTYVSECGLSEELREELIQTFWTNVYAPQAPADPGTSRKKRKQRD